MYKKDIYDALSGLTVSPGGGIHMLMHAAEASEPAISQAISTIANFNADSMQTGSNSLAKALRPLEQAVLEISIYATIVEIDNLGTRFDSIFIQFPQLKPFLQIGRKAITRLGEQVERAYKLNKTAPALLGLVEPLLTLTICLVHYEELCKIFAPKGPENTATIEIDDIANFPDLASFMHMLAELASAAEGATQEFADDSEFVGKIVIESIESGSPIQIKFSADGRTLRFFLAMIRDAVGCIYRKRSAHGQLMEAMETLKVAKALGMPDEAIELLTQNVIATASNFSVSVPGHEPVVTVQGVPIKKDDPRLIPHEEVPQIEQDPRPRKRGLTGPK